MIYWLGVGVGVREGTHEKTEAVEDEGHVELPPTPLIVLAQHKGIRVDELTLLPAAPMPDTLPHDGQRAGDHQVPEDGVEDQRPLREVVAVDIDAGEAAGHPARRHPEHPVPLPATSDGDEPLLGG